MTESQPYGVRHFLRRLDPEGVSELRRRAIVLREGRTASKGEYFDLDRVRLQDLLVYRTLVLRRSPSASRPPAPYGLAWKGRWYDVWERDTSTEIAAHRPLGDAIEPGAPARCPVVTGLAPGGRIAGYTRPVNLAWPLGRGRVPAGWTPQPGGA